MPLLLAITFPHLPSLHPGSHAFVQIREARVRVRWFLCSSRLSRNSSSSSICQVQPLQLLEAGVRCRITGLSSGSPVTLPESHSIRPLGLVSAGIRVFTGVTHSPPGRGWKRFCHLLPPRACRSPLTPADRQSHQVAPAFVMWPVLLRPIWVTGKCQPGPNRMQIET